MQKNLKKSVAFVAMVAFASIEAGAQNVKFSGFSQEKLDSMSLAMANDNSLTFVEELATPQVLRFVTNDETKTISGKAETFHAGDTVYVTAIKYYWNGAPKVKYMTRYSRVASEKTEIVANPLSATLDTVEVRTKAAAKLVNNQQDTRWLETSDGHTIVESVVKENGLYGIVEGHYQMTNEDGANGFGFMAGGGYQIDRFFNFEGGAGASWNKYYDGSELAGQKYFTWYLQLQAGAKYDFGRRRNYAVHINAGGRWTHQDTKSREIIDRYGNKMWMQSGGKTFGFLGGAGFSYRLSDTGWRVYLGYQAAQVKRVALNNDAILGWNHEIVLRVNIPTWGKSVKTVLK